MKGIFIPIPENAAGSFDTVIPDGLVWRCAHDGREYTEKVEWSEVDIYDPAEIAERFNVYRKQP